MPLTLLLCDDHALFREALALLLEQQPGWRVVAQAADGGEAVHLASGLRPDVAVLDLAMPEVSGIDAAKAIRAACPDTAIIALSMYGDEHYRQLMFSAGAGAYVLKSQAGAELVEAIRAVRLGGTYISPQLCEREPAPLQSGIDQTLAKLTVREREVLGLLVKGHRHREIAETLGISPKTVETHRGHLMDKCGLDHFADLVKFAIRAGIVSPE